MLLCVPYKMYNDNKENYIYMLGIPNWLKNIPILLDISVCRDAKVFYNHLLHELFSVQMASYYRHYC